MKKGYAIILFAVVFFMTARVLFADDSVVENDIDGNSLIQNNANTSASATKVDAVHVKVDKTFKIAPAYEIQPRERTFQLGLVGPGIYYGNKTIDAMIGMGLEGEYYFFEHLAAGMRVMFSTDFHRDSKINSVVSFVPYAKYVFDFENHPRWSAYVQAGVGVSLLDGGHASADIAIPSGGILWHWNQGFSIGFDASLHILARSSSAVAFFAGPVVRYQF